MKAKEKKASYNKTILYEVVKWFLVLMSIGSFVSAYFMYNDLSSNTLLHSWEKVCSTHPEKTREFSDCMENGFKQIDSVQDQMVGKVITGILVPIVFFSVRFGYRYSEDVQDRRHGPTMMQYFMTKYLRKRAISDYWRRGETWMSLAIALFLFLCHLFAAYIQANSPMLRN
jgi:hypothetical protein